jgi:hypothetical protein
MRMPPMHAAAVSKKNNAVTKNQSDADTISSMLKEGGRSFLSMLKKKSIRANNSWYRLLSQDKRRFIDAVIQTVDKIRSSLLLKVLTPIIGKLLQALGGIRGLMGNLAYGLKNFGQPLAKRISTIATKWGNNLAAKWADDEGFIRFLTVIDMNDPSFFKINGKL